MKEQTQQEYYEAGIQFIGQVPFNMQVKIWLLWTSCFVAALWTIVFVRVNFMDADVQIDLTPAPRIIGRR